MLPSNLYRCNKDDGIVHAVDTLQLTLIVDLMSAIFGNFQDTFFKSREKTLTHNFRFLAL